MSLNLVHEGFQLLSSCSLSITEAFPTFGTTGNASEDPHAVAAIFPPEPIATWARLAFERSRGSKCAV
eukprot:3299043-Prymnesium_polylepis.1